MVCTEGYSIGLGFDRTVNGSANVNQYPDSLCNVLNDINTCPENVIAWFHHVPWDYKMKSGRTFWDELCHKYDEGVHQARQFLVVWDAMKPYVDCQRFCDVQRRLRIQARDSEWWRDACLLYFQTFSKRPIPQDMEHPVHNLDESRRIWSTPSTTSTRCRSSGSPSPCMRTPHRVIRSRKNESPPHRRGFLLTLNTKILNPNYLSLSLAFA